MKKLWKGLWDRARQPRWRHGWRAWLAMAGFLALCVMVNALVGALEDAYGWRRDMSFNGYATTGEETSAALAALEHDVELYLLYQGDDRDEQVLQVLERYRTLCGRVSVLPTDIAANPGVLTRFGTGGQSAAADTVIVNCPDTGRFQSLDCALDFWTQGYDIQQGAFVAEGLAYEKRLTEAIVTVAQDEVPVMGILGGHGELTAQELSTFTDFLASNGYAAREVNLLKGGALDGIDLLLIADPVNDLDDAELEAISAFAREGGSLLATRDYTDPLAGMDNYLSLLGSYGVKPLAGVVVAGEEDAGSYYGERLYLLPYMADAELTAELTEGGMDVLLMPAACAFAVETGGDASLEARTVLKSGPNAYLRDPSDGDDSIERKPGDPTGEMSVAVLARRMHANGNLSRLFVLGGSALLTDEYIYQRTDCEAFLVKVLGEMLPQKTVSLDIMARPAFRPALRVGAQGPGLAMLIALPVLVALAGLCVLLPRRNR